jgi:hypothetical protein
VALADSVAAVAAVAASDKDKSTKVKGHEHSLLFLLLFDDLYSDVNMTLRARIPYRKRRLNNLLFSRFAILILSCSRIGGIFQ